MRPLILSLLMLIALATPGDAESQQFGPQPDAKAKAELMRDREEAWRAFFANDRSAFNRLVPDELLAISWDGGPWADKAQTLANMTEVAKSGRKLTALEFPRTVFQQYGDAVILYSTFRAVISSSDGTKQEILGRGTEVFVRRAGRWAHTAWHLDRTPE
ncbi:MAG: YybH family protein [Gemmatimonas sp.]